MHHSTNKSTGTRVQKSNFQGILQGRNSDFRLCEVGAEITIVSSATLTPAPESDYGFRYGGYLNTASGAGGL
jgi:hypothetical protein